MTKVLKLLGGGWFAAILGIALISNALHLMKTAIPTNWSMARRFRAAVSFMDRVWDVCLTRVAVSGENVPGMSATRTYPRPRGYGHNRSVFSSA